jgi:hypothetical protein
MATTHAIRNGVLEGQIISMVRHIKVKFFVLLFMKVEIGEGQCGQSKRVLFCV